MNKPNFEKYIKKQEELEKIPQISPQFHFAISDISKKIINGETLNEKDISDLEIVFEMTQSLEEDLISVIDNDRSQGKISTEEFLICADYFLTSNQNGPDSTILRDAIINKDMSFEDFEYAVHDVQMPPYTRQLLLFIYRKIT